MLFGLGVGSYLLLGSIIGQRLFVVPELPKPLLPTIAIELAPPVVAASSWFAINGGRVDTTAAVISGFAVLMVLAQLRLIPLYRTAPFGPAYWAFSFPAAAAVTCGLHWLGGRARTRRHRPRLRPRRPAIAPASSCSPRGRSSP